MELVKIENYRGYEVYYCPHKLEFHAEGFSDGFKKSKSHKALRKQIDDYYNEHPIFEPKVISKLHLSAKEYTLYGIKANGACLIDANGKKKILGEYEIEQMVILDETSKPIFEEYRTKLVKISSEIRKLQREELKLEREQEEALQDWNLTKFRDEIVERHEEKLK